MRLNALRPIALTLVTLLAVAGPARAGTITFADLQAASGAGRFRPASELRVRVASQGAAVAGAHSAQGQQGGTQVAVAQQPNGAAPAGSGAAANPAGGADATLSQSGGQVETVDLGDVTGTVCDCGEIPRSIIPRGVAFPWWTLAGIPLVCVSGICFGDDDTPPPNNPPPPPPPPNPIPEPATLLLFGSGLLAAGAGARRRRRQSVAQTAAAEEV